MSGLDWRLQHPEHRPVGRTAYARSRASPVVPVVFSWRAWPRRAGGKPEAAVPAAVGIMVAELAVRRSDLRADRGILRQSRFRRGGDPVLPSPLRPRTGRFEPGCDRASACRTTADHGATIVLHGACDGVSPPQSSEGHARFFTGPYQRRVVPVAGHFLPQEAPAEVVEALSELCER